MTESGTGRTASYVVSALAVVGLGCLTPVAVSQEQEPEGAPSPLILTPEEFGPGVEVLSMEPVTVQAHRGFGKGYPENTMEAFVAAWELGAIPEGDVRITKDGVMCFFHDTTMAKKSDAPEEWQELSISDLTWEQTSTLDVGTWVAPEFAGQRIPTMDAVLKRLAEDPDRRMYLDIKYADAELLAEALHEGGAAAQARICSPRPEEMRQYHGLIPEAECMVWIPGDPGTIKERFDEMQAFDFDGIGRIQIHCRAPEIDGGRALSPPAETLEWVRRTTKAAGVKLEVFLFTECDELMGYALNLGVDSFATDSPAWCAERLWAFGAPGWE